MMQPTGIKMYLQADLPKILCRIPWFTELSPAQVNSLASIATLQELDWGEILFHEGDREECLYILLEGQITLEVEVPTRGIIPIFTAEMWDIFGWSSMTPIIRQRTASARCAAPCLILGLNHKLLQQLCEEDHDLGYVIMRRLANVVANRLLTTRLCLFELIAQDQPHAV